MQIGRTRLAVAWLSDGRLFAIGGNTGRQGPTATVEMIECTGDRSTGQWSYVAPLPNPRQCHAAAVIGGKVVVVGGTAERAVTMFAPPTQNNPTGQWTEIVPLPKPMELLALVPAHGHLMSICETPWLSRLFPLNLTYKFSTWVIVGESIRDCSSLPF